MRSDVDAVVVLYLVHHKRALQRTQAVDGSQHIENELLIVFHVRCMNLEQVVIAARDIVAFRHLRNVADDAREFVGYLLVEPAELHAAEHHEAPVELVSIEHRDVFSDVAVALQPFEAFKDWS